MNASASSASDPSIIAIDPGRAKCGIAVLDPVGIRHRAIVEVDQLPARIVALVAEFQTKKVVIGSGTRAIASADLVKSAVPGVVVYLEDELYTTLEARRRYFQEHPPRGWRRLLPLSLQVPPEPYDDFAAVIVGERFLAKRRQTS